MTELHLYLENGLYWYDTEGGKMCCPPFVKGREAARRFFGDGYLLHFMGEEQHQERKANRIMEWPRIAPEPKVEKSRTPRREKKSRGIMGRPRMAVAQYRLDGTFIKVWTDCNEAAISLGCSRSGLSKCCHGETKSSCGYMWRLVINGEYPEKIDEHTVKRKLSSNRAKAVICKDVNGNIIGRYKSTVEAGRAVGMSARMIRYYCAEGRKMPDGRDWSYK